MWARRIKENKVNQCIWDNVELFSQVTREQPTNHQTTMKFTNTPNSNNIVNIATNEIGNEVINEGNSVSLHIQCQSRVQFFAYLFCSFFALFFCQPDFSLFLFLSLGNEMKISINERHRNSNYQPII